MRRLDYHACSIELLHIRHANYALSICRYTSCGAANHGHNP
jgi:hypothetical protein